LREMPSNMSMSAHFQIPVPGGPRQPLSINTTFDGKTVGRSYPSAGLGPMTSMGGMDIGPMEAGPAAMSIWEILKTEKKYVSDLEVLQVSHQSSV
jgi:hypothetical protein